MAQTTTHLALPLIAAAQAGKHVTHNEALVGLDTLVQLACLDKDLVSPPANPAEGDRYLVAASAPTGAWTGLSQQVVRFEDGAWTGYQPKPGWLAFVIDEAAFYLFTGSGWISLQRTFTALQDLARLGIGTEADSQNRLALKSDAALFSFDETASGSGSMRLAMNKKAPGDDVGIAFQDGFSTRALFGLFGNDRISLKVSPDGVRYAQALTVDPATGGIGLNLTGQPEAGLHLTTLRSGVGPGTVPHDVRIDAYGGGEAASVAPAASLIAQVARGTPASPSGIKAADLFFALLGAGWRSNGGYSGDVIAIQGVAEEDFTATGNGTAIDFQTTAISSTSRRSVVKLRANGSLELQPLASPPVGGLAPGQIVFDSTAAAFKAHDGTRWNRLSNRTRFAATTNFDNYVPPGSWTKVRFNAADSNDQGAFSAADSRFTAGDDGLHAFTANLGFKRNGSNAPTAFEAQFYRNGGISSRGRGGLPAPLADGISALALSTFLMLDAGDTVEVFVRFSGADGYVAAADSLFAGHQIG